METNFLLDDKGSIFRSKYLLYTWDPTFISAAPSRHFLTFSHHYKFLYCPCHGLQCTVFINDLTVQDCNFPKIFTGLCHSAFLTSPSFSTLAHCVHYCTTAIHRVFALSYCVACRADFQCGSCMSSAFFLCKISICFFTFLSYNGCFLGINACHDELFPMLLLRITTVLSGEMDLPSHRICLGVICIYPLPG